MKKALLIGVVSLLFQIDLFLEFESAFTSPFFTFTIAFIIAFSSLFTGILMRIVKKYERMLHCFTFSISSFLAIASTIYILDYEQLITHQRAEEIIFSIENFHRKEGEYPHKLKYCLKEVPNTALGGLLLKGKYLYTRQGNHFNLDYIDSYGEVLTYDSKTHTWISRH